MIMYIYVERERETINIYSWDIFENFDFKNQNKYESRYMKMVSYNLLDY